MGGSADLVVMGGDHEFESYYWRQDGSYFKIFYTSPTGQANVWYITCMVIVIKKKHLLLLIYDQGKDCTYIVGLINQYGGH